MALSAFIKGDAIDLVSNLEADYTSVRKSQNSNSRLRLEADIIMKTATPTAR